MFGIGIVLNTNSNAVCAHAVVPFPQTLFGFSWISKSSTRPRLGLVLSGYTLFLFHPG